MLTQDEITQLLKELKDKNVKLLAASKGRSTQEMMTACQAEVKIFGENYVQEAEGKMQELSGLDIEWHLIGPLQNNKVKKAVELFDSIDTVDSEKLAVSLNKEAGIRAKKLPVMIQVNISDETTKNGVPIRNAEELAEKITRLENLTLTGLMSIGSTQPDQAINEFKQMKLLFDRLRKKYRLTTLSMGMSDDYPEAIKQGATMVRLGTALFGPRN